MNDAQSAKQQIVERIKDSSNILVTVSQDPSVDELSAALGLTIMLGTLKKHATAVVSGALPPAIEFLEPGKTFENTVDSLRDFIIALDKEKADHLRYKVDGDVVKIFITPYRTTITDKDLDFSQGDYNVELVLALGVRDESHLDKALEAHGKILHDATVATLSSGNMQSKLGSIDWYEQSASSICEMLVSLSEALKSDKPLLDEQVSTALLTGIVAATDRFSNNLTSSKVMTMAAQLMAAGANQQLIAAKLSEADEITSDGSDDTPTPGSDNGQENNDGTTDLEEGASTKLEGTGKQSRSAKKSKSPKTPPAETPSDRGTLSISHELEGSVDDVAKQVDQSNTDAAAEEAEHALADQLQATVPAASTPSVADLRKDIASANKELDEAASQQPASAPSEIPLPDYEPTIGGTLNATTEQAAEDKRREEQSGQNHTILNHGGSPRLDDAPVLGDPPFGAATVAASDDATSTASDLSAPTAIAAPIEPPVADQTLADLDAATRGASHDDARAAVAAAFDAIPSQPTPPPSVPAFGSGATPQVADNSNVASPAMPPVSDGLPPLPDFTTLPPPPPPIAGGQTAPADSAAVFPPKQPEQLGGIFSDAPAAPAPQPTDPSQFKIPGQS